MTTEAGNRADTKGQALAEQHAPAQEPLVTALARAFHWQEMLDTGKYATVTELAAALGVDRSYVGRILRLTLLAPDIVELIVAGKEPSGLSLERLVKAMPVEWAEQRRGLKRSVEGRTEIGDLTERAPCRTRR